MAKKGGTGTTSASAVTLAPVRMDAPPFAIGDESHVIAFERDMRVYRAHSEEVRIVLGEHPGSFTVSATVAHASAADALERTYSVDLVDQRASCDACSCPDFLYAMLGTCKHIAAVRRAAKEDPLVRRQIARLPKDVATERGAVLTAQSDGALRLVALGANSEGLLARLHARREDNNGDVIVASSQLRQAAGAGASAERVTRAAIVAARVLEARRDQAERAREIREALESGKLGVDVLAAPLFPYQREGVAHLLRAGRAVLADDMGLGKTVQTLAACEVLRRRGEAKRILIVCPASLKAQWASEIARYTGAQAVVIVGGAERRRAAFASDAPYVVLNYELTWRDLSLLKNLEADVLVLDEAQRAKNFRTKTAATLRSIPSRFLFVLTGTPVENRLDDLYGILQLVDGEVLGPLWKFNFDFHERDPLFGNKIVGYKNLSELRRRIAPVVLRRRKEAVLSQLPALTEQTRYVTLSKEQIALEKFHRVEAAKLAMIAEKRSLTPSEQNRLLAMLLKARQACNAAVLCKPESSDRAPAKLEELAALVSEIALQGTSKVLVFSEWTEMLKLAADRLDALGVGHLMLHGGVPTEKRPALIDQFRSDAGKVVLLSTDAGGVGLNLQVASYVIHLDLPWNPARLDQRIARAHRLGQTRGVSVTYLCAEVGIERGIEGTLAGKRAVRSAATDGASDVDELEAPTFSAFLREARTILGDASEPPPAAHEIDDEPAASRGRRTRPAAPAPPPPPPERRSPALASSKLQASEAFALQRLRLAHVVLAAGFPGDAVRAAYEAIAASLRARLEQPIDDEHASLLAAVHSELLPSGAIPSTLPAVLAKIHDLCLVDERGEAVDPAIAATAVEDARGWLERAEAWRVDR